MTSLEKFLNRNKEELKNHVLEPASGTFNCQDRDCDEKVFEGYIDRTNNRLHWVCSQGHESSVVI